MSTKVIDFSKVIGSSVKSKYRNKNALAPFHPSNLIISAPTNSGKTNLLMNMLFSESLKMTYDRIILACPSLDEEFYTWMQEHFTKLQAKIEEKAKEPLGYDIFIYFQKPEEIPEPRDLPGFKNEGGRNLQTIFIIDDFVAEKKMDAVVKKYCILNRKINTSIIYLSQSYFDIPKLVRRQLSNGCLFFSSNCSGMELSILAREFAHDITEDEFKKIYKYATHERYKFFMIDFKAKNSKMRYRKDLDEFLGPEEKPIDAKIKLDPTEP